MQLFTDLKIINKQFGLPKNAQIKNVFIINFNFAVEFCAQNCCMLFSASSKF